MVLHVGFPEAESAVVDDAGGVWPAWARRRVSPGPWGLSSDTPLASNRGLIPAGKLKAGDCVRGVGGDWLPVSAVVTLAGTAGDVIARRAVTIAAHSLGPGCPANDITVGPEQQIVIYIPEIASLCGSARARLSAGDLLGLPGVGWSAATTDLVLIVFDEPALIDACGVAFAGFSPDADDLDAMTPSHRDTLYAAAPRLRYEGGRSSVAHTLPRLDRREIEAALSAKVSVAPSSAPRNRPHEP